MATLNTRNLPDEIHRVIKVEAVTRGVSQAKIITRLVKLYQETLLTRTGTDVNAGYFYEGLLKQVGLEPLDIDKDHARAREGEAVE